MTDGSSLYRVRYYLHSGISDCGVIDQDVQIFLGAADAPPPATPTVLHTLHIDASALAAGSTYVDLQLTSPVFVEADESLFVSVEQIYVNDWEKTCPTVCNLDGDPGSELVVEQ